MDTAVAAVSKPTIHSGKNDLTLWSFQGETER